MTPEDAMAALKMRVCCTLAAPATAKASCLTATPAAAPQPGQLKRRQGQQGGALKRTLDFV